MDDCSNLSKAGLTLMGLKMENFMLIEDQNMFTIAIKVNVF